MIQTIIIDEKYINTMKSCGYNCDLSSIENSINHSDCKEFRDCKLIGGSFDVCEVINFFFSNNFYVKKRENKLCMILINN